MNIDNQFNWNDLKEILLKLLLELWEIGYKTDICGDFEGVDSSFRPLTLIKITDPAKPNRMFTLKVIAGPDKLSFSLQLEVFEEAMLPMSLDVLDGLGNVLEETVANLLILPIDDSEGWPKPPVDGALWSQSLEKEGGILIIERGRDHQRTTGSGWDLGIRIYKKGDFIRGRWCYDLRSAANRLRELTRAGIIQDAEHDKVKKWLMENVYFYQMDVGFNQNPTSY
jgi:hypothetical protein